MARPSLRARKGAFKARAAGLSGETGVDLREFNRAAGKLIDHLAAIPGRAEDRFRSIALRLFTAIQSGDPSRGLPGTPIDIGAARAAWRIDDESTADMVRIVIRNRGVAYIVYLEFGWSNQAPRGMVRIALRAYVCEFNKLSKGLAGGR